MPVTLEKRKMSDQAVVELTDKLSLIVKMTQCPAQLKNLAKTAGIKDEQSFLLVCRQNESMIQNFQNNAVVFKEMQDAAAKELAQKPDHVVLVPSHLLAKNLKEEKKQSAKQAEPADVKTLQQMVAKLTAENKGLQECAEEATTLHASAIEALKAASAHAEKMERENKANQKPKEEIKREPSGTKSNASSTGGSQQPKTSREQPEERGNPVNASETRTANATKSKFVANPGKFQLKIWKTDEQLDFWEHLSRNRIAIKNAKQAGLTDSQLISLFMLTLRPEDGFLDELIEEEERADFETFLETLGRYLSGSPSTMMNTMLNTTRKPNESLIAFFIRLCSMYKTSSGKDPKSPEAAGFLHPIIVNNSTKIQKTELIRELETVERGRARVTFDALKSAVKKAQIMDDSNYSDSPADLVYKIDNTGGTSDENKSSPSGNAHGERVPEKNDSAQRWQRNWEDRPRRAWTTRPERGWDRDTRRGDRAAYRNDKRQDRYEFRQSNNRRDPLCYNCNNRGHMWRECSTPLKERFIRLQKTIKDREASAREEKTPSGTSPKN